MLSKYNIKILNKIIELLTDYLRGNINFRDMIRNTEIQNNNLEDYLIRKDIYNTLRSTYQNHRIMPIEEQINVLTQLNERLTKLISEE